MNQSPVRSDTPDPRVGMYHIDLSSADSLDISSTWPYFGTNNSALKRSTLAHTVPNEFKWKPIGVGQQLQHECSLFSNNMSSFKHKRHWQSDDDRYADDPPPFKQHINEEKVAQQFHNMSLCGDKQSSRSADSQSASFLDLGGSQAPPTVNAMWQRFHEIENKLDDLSDIDIDEGVDMGSDIDASNTCADSTSQEPKLHMSSDLKARISANPLPQILVPKPCKEIILWQPSGVEFIKKSLTPDNEDAPQTNLSAPETAKPATRRKKIATRTLSPSFGSLLMVPTIRPDTPPPNTRTSPVSQDIPVCFLEEPQYDLDMDI